MNRPYVILNSAMTLDGKIATKRGDSQISDKDDWTYVHKLRNKVDAIMVGINTVIVDDPMLNVRLAKKIKDPKRIIVDSSGRIPLTSQIVKSAKEIKTYLAVTNSIKEDKISQLESNGLEIVVCGDKKHVDLTILMEKLYEKEVKKVLLEGGSTLNWGMLSAHLVHEVRITIGPHIVGGKDAKTLVDGDGFDTIADGVNLELVDFKRTGNYIRLKYFVT